jgi:hypothetical protein
MSCALQLRGYAGGVAIPLARFVGVALLGSFETRETKPRCRVRPCYIQCWATSFFAWVAVVHIVPGLSSVADRLARTRLAMKFSTQKLYPHLLGRHLLPVFGDRPLCDIRRVDIQRFVTEKMTRQNLSWQTAVHLRNLMSGTLERAVEWGYLEANPGRRIKVPPMQRRHKTVVLTVSS